MDLFGIGTLVSGLANSGVQAANVAVQKKIADDNLAFQKEQYNYQKNLQQQIFAREDNAMQRAAADLQSAGLSKTLAAGNGAGAGAVVATQAPQYDGSGIGNAMSQLGAIAQGIPQQLQQMELSERQMRVTERLADAEIENMTGQRALDTEKFSWQKVMDTTHNRQWEKNFMQAKTESERNYALEKMKLDIIKETADLEVQERKAVIANYEKWVLYSDEAKKIRDSMPIEMKMAIMNDALANSWGNVLKGSIQSASGGIVNGLFGLANPKKTIINQYGGR